MSDSGEFIARNYQVELMKIALEKNTIIYLPTGSGKTFIALLVLKEMSECLLRSYNDGGKITVILVNTVALVDQHASYINTHTNFEVGKYSGEMNVDIWPKEKWYEEYNKYQVIIMTSQILVNLVTWNYIDLNKINLLILDECHRGVNDQPMRQLMKNFQFLSEPPRVLGLTATLLNGNCKKSRVKQQVEELEATYHSKVATVEDLKAVIGFSTNPKEFVTLFTNYEVNTKEQQAIDILRKIVCLLKSIRIEPLNVPALVKDLKPLNVEEGPKKLWNLIEDLTYHIFTMGAYGGYKACLAHIIQMERIKKHCEDIKFFTLLTAIQTSFTLISHKLKSVIDLHEEKEAILKCSSDQIVQLISILRNYKHEESEDMCCLIFTQRRFTAKIIFYILDALSQCNPEFSHIKSNFIVGNNFNPFNDTREALFIHKQNKQILDSFARKEINVLVASNVLEEGVDIPKCTLVIKYDAPTDYRSYIQSKGRARHKESLYYVMVKREEYQRFQNKYNEYKAVEEALNDYLIGKNELRNDPCKLKIEAMYDEDLIPPYFTCGPGSAQITMQCSIPLLCQYCQSLPADIYTEHAPDWYIKKMESNGLPLLQKFSVCILLPTVCKIMDIIEGPFMPTIKMAKRAAAQEACIRLHKAGELDDHLQPVKRIVNDEDVDFLFKHYPDKSESFTNNLKTRRLHRKLIPDVVKEAIQPSSTAYVHIIQLEPNFENNLGDLTHSTLYDMHFSNLCYGIVTQKRLPTICEFPIYVTMGTIKVLLKVNQVKVILSKTDLNDIKKFHLEVFDQILIILPNFVAFDIGKEPEMMLLVPVNKQKNDIDWNVLREYIEIKQIVEMSNEEKLKIEVNQETYLKKIVSPWYRRDPVTYIVTEVCFNKTAESRFPNENYSTFREYFSTKHNIELRNPNLPLLLVKGLTKSLNFIKPKGKTSTKRKHEKIYYEVEEFLPPELVVKQEFPAPLWIQANFLPTILMRVSFMLQLEELRCKIAREKKGLGEVIIEVRQPLELDDYVLDYEPFIQEETDLMPMDSDSTQLLYVPQPIKINQDFNDKLLEAQYPWKNIEEPKDIERFLDATVMDIEHYEVFVGHRVSHASRELKNKVSLVKQRQQLALTYHKDFVPVKIEMLETPLGNCGPELCELYRALTSAKSKDIVNLERLETLGDSVLKLIASIYIYMRFPQYDEGRATQLKGRLVSNRNLYYLAVKKNINEVFKFNELAKNDWLPPALAIPSQMLNRIIEKEISINALFGLSIPFEEQVSGQLSNGTVEDILKDECPLTDTEESSYQTMAPFLKSQYIGDKQIADAVESLLGAYFQAGGFSGGIKFIEWLDLIPESERLEDRLREPPENPLITKVDCENKIRRHLPLHEEIEKIIGYNFNNIAFLLQALTHSSYTPNRTTHSYEKLEFVGDAVLDFLITIHIFESCGSLDPGKLTDLRSALVNNNTFASLVVRLGLQKYILLANLKLQKLIDKFVIFMEQKNYVIDDEIIILLQEEEIQMAESVDVPKVLGDIFEAIIGAIYLDSNKDLKIVWDIVYKIMWKEIDLFSNNVPMNVVRKVFEWPGAHPLFGKAVLTKNNRSMVPLRFTLNGIPKDVHGFGTNRAMARRAAAKLALRVLDVRDR